MTEDSSNNNFDPYDEITYYYGNVNRESVKDILSEAVVGTFLVRDSVQDPDQKVLCVKEAQGVVNNYKIIHTINDDSDEAVHSFFIKGKEECIYESIPKILQFYMSHILSQTELIRPAFHHKQVIATSDFLTSNDPTEDLYFEKNDILTVIEFTQGEHWWNASLKNKTGLIPTTLVRRLKPDEIIQQNDESLKCEITSEQNQIICPFKAIVITDYRPSIFNESHIALKKGQLVTVLDMKADGKWYGQTHGADGNVEFGKKGFFPFINVEIVEN